MSILEGQPLEIDDEEDDTGPEVAGDFSYALGPGISAALTRRGPELLVCFGSLAPVAAAADAMDWSVLHLEAESSDDLLGDRVVGFFDALLDSTLLDEFDAVLFFGSGGGTAAALGYAICAPLARILIIAPGGSLPEIGRFAPSPANLAVAETIDVIYDPRDDAMSDTARAIAARGCSSLPMRFAGGEPLTETLSGLGALDDILEDAMSGQLSRRAFFRALRARRHNNRYTRRLIGRIAQSDRHPVLHAIALRHIGLKQGRSRFRRQYEELVEKLSERGVTVPPTRDGG